MGQNTLFSISKSFTEKMVLVVSSYVTVTPNWLKHLPVKWGRQIPKPSPDWRDTNPTLHLEQNCKLHRGCASSVTVFPPASCLSEGPCLVHWTSVLRLYRPTLLCPAGSEAANSGLERGLMLESSGRSDFKGLNTRQHFIHPGDSWSGV